MLWRFLTFDKFDLVPLEVKTGTSVSPANGKIHANFIFSMLFLFSDANGPATCWDGPMINCDVRPQFFMWPCYGYVAQINKIVSLKQKCRISKQKSLQI